MTVREMIARLSKCDPDAEVLHVSTGGVWDFVYEVNQLEDVEARAAQETYGGADPVVVEIV